MWNKIIKMYILKVLIHFEYTIWEKNIWTFINIQDNSFKKINWYFYIVIFK